MVALGERSPGEVVLVALLRLLIAAVGPAAAAGVGRAQRRVVLAGRSTAQTGWTLPSLTWGQSRPSADVELAPRRPGGAPVPSAASDDAMALQDRGEAHREGAISPKTRTRNRTHTLIRAIPNRAV
jgi:hypothetical protein